MRKKEDACLAWKQICKNCKNEEEYFGGAFTAAWKNTLSYVKTCALDADKFSIALLAKDEEAVKSLYNETNFDEKIISKIEEMLKVNNELLLTLNPFILQEKYSFLEPFYNELALDVFAEDLLLSLDDYELKILKKITEHALSYGVNSSNLIDEVISNMGKSSIPGRNFEANLIKENEFIEMIKELENEGTLTDDIIEIVGYILKAGVYPSNKEELKNFEDSFKKDILKDIQIKDNIDYLKNDILLSMFGMNISDSEDLINSYNIDDVSEELLLEPGIVEFVAIKKILKENDIDNLKKVLTYLVNSDKFHISLYSSCLVEKNILKVFAKEFNKCKPEFTNSNLIATIDNVKVYDSSLNFYAIAKTLGAFSSDGSGIINYCDEWNDDRYRSHVNAVSLIRNDNLAFAEQDGKMHIKVGFCDFDEDMFLGGANQDINTTPDSRCFGVKVYSELSCPSRFIDATRKWHNELDYERKDLKGKKFKKNPDFLILDQECEDIAKLSDEERKEYEEYKANTIRAAKEFGNLPILLINREKIAKNEINLINEMLTNYESSHDYNLLKNIIIKFNNNRNGCRGAQHKYIRENYFSDKFFQELLNRIDSMIDSNQRQVFYEFVENEHEKMSRCGYDKSTKSLPVEPNHTNQRGGLNV